MRSALPEQDELADLLRTIVRSERRAWPPWLAATVTSVVLFTLGHLGAAIWFGSAVAANVRAIGQSVEEIKGEVTQMRTYDAQLQVLRTEMSEFRRRLETLEGKRR